MHLLNLLTIPAIVLVYYFRKYEFSWGGVILAFLASVGILAFVLYGIIPGVPTVAGWFELAFVNGMGLPFNTGLAVYLVLLAAALVWAVVSTAKAEKIGAQQIIAFLLAFTLAGTPFLRESVVIGLLVVAVLAVILFVKKEMV